jgi:hypothetical protein
MAYLNEEDILECLFSHLKNEYDSEDCDGDAAEEFTRLEVTNSVCVERDGAFAEEVDISEEGTEPDRKNSDTTEDGESEWGDGISYVENITRTRDKNLVIYPELNKEDPEVDYILSILTEETLEIIQDQTNPYAT